MILVKDTVDEVYLAGFSVLKFKQHPVQIITTKSGKEARQYKNISLALNDLISIKRNFGGMLDNRRKGKMYYERFIVVVLHKGQEIKVS